MLLIICIKCDFWVVLTSFICMDDSHSESVFFFMQNLGTCCCKDFVEGFCLSAISLRYTGFVRQTWQPCLHLTSFWYKLELTFWSLANCCLATVIIRPPISSKSCWSGKVRWWTGEEWLDSVVKSLREIFLDNEAIRDRLSVRDDTRASLLKSYNDKSVNN